MVLHLSTNEKPLDPAINVVYENYLKKVANAKLPTHQRIFNILIEQGIDTATSELIVSQAYHESGSFKNSLSRHHRNVFSRLHHKRDSLSLGPFGRAEGRKDFASYASLDSAVISQLCYFKRKGYSMKWNNTYAFALELKKKNYYKDNPLKYSRALQRIRNQLYGN